MTDYIYAGKGWEPQVGDVCEALHGLDDAWKECTIFSIGNPLMLPVGVDCSGDYTIDVPEFSDAGSTLWLCGESNLRIKRPRQQDNESCDAEFLEWIKRLDEEKHGVPVKMKT